MSGETKSKYSEQAFEAFKNKDLHTLKSILEKNVHPDDLKDCYNNTLLYEIGDYNFMLEKEHFEMFKLLLEYGANPNIDEHNPLIHCLCKRKEVFSEEMIQLAISFKADIHSFNYHEKNSLLQSAAYYGKTWFVKYLIGYGLDVNYENTKGQNALYDSINAFRSNIETIQCLLDNGANKSDLFKLHDGKLILKNIISGKKMDVLKFIVSIGVDINTKNKHGFAIIVDSAEYGPAEMFNEILELGANLDNCLGNVLHRIEYRMRDKGSKKETVEVAFEKLKILYNRKYPIAVLDYYKHNQYDILTEYAESIKNRKAIKKYEENIILALLEMGFKHKYKKSFLEYLERTNNIKIKNYLEMNT